MPKTLPFRLVALDSEQIPDLLSIEQEVNPVPWKEPSFQQELNSPQSVFQVALSQSVPVGYCAAWIALDELHIINVAVRGEMQGKGVGSKLVDAILREGYERGATCATLEVRASNSVAIALYEKFGFEKVALRKRYYPDNREDAIIYWLYDLSSYAA
ncbi:MAG: ribosomal protein S18-alanine N-acetyltransferase [Fimbriimonadaceae bacterium]